MDNNIINRACDALAGYSVLLRHLAKYGVTDAQPLADDADRIVSELKEADNGR